MRESAAERRCRSLRVLKAVPRASHRTGWALRLLLCASIALATTTASAVLIITGNGNTSAPPGTDDPGFAHIGQRSSGGLTLIYLGNGWVLTANHVGEADLLLASVVYPHVPGSGVRFVNDDLTLADLMAFRIVGSPQLPALPILEIALLSPGIGTPVTMIGRGYNQDAPTSWMGLDGWSWGTTGGAIRWGTNVVADPAGLPVDDTDSFPVDFTKPGEPGVTTHEAQVVTGDSGGAVFARNLAGNWELAGVLFAAHGFFEQPAQTALEGNLSYSVDLARFRDQIIPLVRPECSDEVDNDGDGNIDYQEDTSCHSPGGQSEFETLPSLGRPALCALTALLIAASILAIRKVRPRPAGRQFFRDSACSSARWSRTA